MALIPRQRQDEWKLFKQNAYKMMIGIILSFISLGINQYENVAATWCLTYVAALITFYYCTKVIINK